MRRGCWWFVYFSYRQTIDKDPSVKRIDMEFVGERR
jgi:hypothetical protein